MKQLQIEAQGAIIVLYESELLGMLMKNPELAKKAFGRGKGIQRVQNNTRREATGFNRWKLYELLKNGMIDKEVIHWVDGMPAEEAKMGLLEFLECEVRNRMVLHNG